MNYVKRNFGGSKSLALGTVEASPKRARGWTIPYRAIAPLAMAVDALIILSTGILSGVVYHLQFVKTQGNLEQFAGSAAVVAALFVTLAKSRNLYELSELLNLKAQTRKVTLQWVIVFAFLTAVAFAMKVGDNFSRGAMITFAITGLVALIVMRVVWRTLLADGLAVRRFTSRRIALIAEQSAAVSSGVLETLTRHGLQLAHHFVLPTGPKESRQRKDVIAQAIASLRGSNVEEIVISAELDHWPEIKGLLSELRVLPLPVNFVPAGSLSELFKLSSHTIGETVTIELQHGPRTLSQRLVKRTADTALALVALLSFLPILLVAALAIKLNSPGPVIFRQTRRGFNGRPFQIFKFRTMTVQEDGDHVVAAQRNDARVTRIGHILRRTSIDELPQLFNVLQGTMSLVGPRPHAMVHDNRFDKMVGNYAYRHHVKPGLTGWAQVNGFRGEMRTVEDIDQRVKLDLWYIDNWTLGTDLKIIFMTVAEIARTKNAY